MAAASCKENREPGGLLVRQGSKLHAKMLSKEAAAPSFRVYYSVASAGAVPFLWESQPGTPKDDDSPSAAAAALAPPLTPPPSYYAAGGGEKGARSRKRRRGIGFPRFAFLRTWSSGRTLPSYSASSSSSSNWSTSSSSSSTMSPVFTVQSSPAAGPRGHHHRRTFSAGEDDADEARCFGMERECCERGIAKGCSVVGAVRNALATVVGGKPAGRRA